MSAMLMPGKNFSITRYVMSDDIDDIQDLRYHVRRRTFFNLLIMYYVCVGLHGPGWLYVLGMPPRADVPLSTPGARVTDLGRGSNLRIGPGRAPCVPRAESTRKDPRPEEKKMPKGEKTHLSIYMYEYILFVHADERGGTCAHVENCQHANQKQLT